MSFSSFELLDHSKPIVVFGRDGQVGKALQTCLKDLKVPVVFLGRADCDLSDEASITQILNQYQPQVIINAAAYTLVDQAELEPELAYQVNTVAPGVLAMKAEELDIPLIHFSTDYVFDGLKKEAYVEIDPTHPQSVYGKTKYEGEEKVRSHVKHIILRTSWVFGIHGHNFLKTILRLIKERDELSIVNDQRGSPTSATLLSELTFNMVQQIAHNKNFKDFGSTDPIFDQDILIHS